MPRKPLLLAVLGLFVVGSVVAILARPKNTSTNTDATPTRCTEELKTCSDGSVVGRVVPTCDFTPCPGSGTEAAFTDGWEKFTSATEKFSLKHPTDWTATETGGQVVLASGSNSLTLATATDDTALWQGSGHRAIPVAGVVATLSDTTTDGRTTRTAWVPRGSAFLVASWTVDGRDETLYYQILSTLRFTE